MPLDSLRGTKPKRPVPRAVRAQKAQEKALAREPDERPEPELNETPAKERGEMPAKERDEMPESALATERDGTPASAWEAVETPEPSLQL